MKKHVIFSLLLLALMAGTPYGVSAQETSEPTNEQGQTYEQWKAENDRIIEANKKIEEQNRKNEEEYNQRKADYDRKMDEYNKNRQSWQDLMNKINTPRPEVTQPPRKVIIRKPTATPTPTPNPIVTILLSIAVEPASGSAQETEQQAIELVNKSFEEKKIAIKKEQVDLITLSSNQVVSELRFPVIVNTDTKLIQVISPSGTKTLTVMPDQAIEAAKQKNGITEVTGVVRLEEFNKQTTYLIEGKKSFKVLRLFTVNRNIETRVSAENGEVVETTRALGTQLAQRLSF